MHSARYLEPLTTLPGVQHLIEEQLAPDWVIRIEHAEVVSRHHTAWQQWGQAVFANANATPVIDALIACRARHPAASIRLHAQCLRPRTQLFYWVHRPQDDTVRAVQPAHRGPVLHRESSNSRLRGAVTRLVQATTSGLGSLVTLLGMLIGSLLLLEAAIAQ